MGIKDVGQEAVRQQQARDQAGKSNFNADKTRYIRREFLGWCCYVGRVTEGNFAGQRAGVVVDEATAERWLAGEDVHWEIPADPFGNLQE